MSGRPRFHVPEAAPGARVELPEHTAHHAREVLRLRTGASVLVFDGQGAEFNADRNLTFTGMVYGPDTGDITIERDSVIRGPFVTGDDMILNRDVTWNYSAADRLAVSNVTTCEEAELYAEWRMDEINWNGASNEVEDASGNAQFDALQQ